MSSSDKSKIDKTLVYGDNTYQNTQVGIISNTYLSGNAWNDAYFKIRSNYSDDNNVRAGIGFENAGSEAAYLYFGGDLFRCIDNAGNGYTLIALGNWDGSNLYLRG